MIITDFLKAIGQLSDRRFRRVLWLGLGLTLILLIAATALMVGLIEWLVPNSTTLPMIGEITWAGDFLSWAAIVLMLVLSMFLMVPVASAFTGLFLDDVAQAVEDKHYPALPAPRRTPFYEALRDSINFLGILIPLSLLAMLFALATGLLGIVLVWAVNGYLLGREYFQMVAMRREGRDGATKLRRKHWWRVWMAGTLMAIPLTVPLVNLLIPILGVATFTHQYHRLAGSSARSADQNPAPKSPRTR